MPKGIRTQEDYEEWLGRLDIPIEATADIETFQDYLRDELGISLPQQVSVLWESQVRESSYEEHGIHAVVVEYPWGKQLRYGIQGMAGLWGWSTVQAIRAEEEW